MKPTKVLTSRMHQIDIFDLRVASAEKVLCALFCCCLVSTASSPRIANKTSNLDNELEMHSRPKRKC